MKWYTSDHDYLKAGNQLFKYFTKNLIDYPTFYSLFNCPIRSHIINLASIALIFRRTWFMSCMFSIECILINFSSNLSYVDYSSIEVKFNSLSLSYVCFRIPHPSLKCVKVIMLTVSS